ncbi:B12-binding domain-containing radical SAM protein, partial [Thermoproteota archaeon]
STSIRNTNPKIVIVWGGVHPTLFPDTIVRSGYADVAVVGDGEIPAFEISKRLLNGLRDFEDIAQVTYMDSNGRISHVPQKEFIDINLMPGLDYSLIDPDKYLYRDISQFCAGASKAKVWVLNTGRGCPFKCTFCINQHSSQKWRFINAEQLVNAIQNVVDKFNPDFIHFQDDLFFCNKERIHAFIKEYDKRGWRFKFFTLTFANYFSDTYINQKMIAWLVGKAVWLGMGVESGSEKIRRQLNKHIRDNKIIEIVTSLKEVDIKLELAFMTGIPIETRRDRFETIMFINLLRKANNNCSFGLQAWRPYPGSELYEIAKVRGFQEPKNIDEWIKAIAKGRGYYDPRLLPWNDKNEIFFYVTFVCAITTQNKSILHKLIYLAMYPFYKLRVLTNNKLPFIEGYPVRALIPVMKLLGIISKV